MMFEKVKSILQKKIGQKAEDITMDTVILSELGMNSFELVQLIATIEDELDIEIEDKALKKFVTVGDVVRYLEDTSTQT